MYPKRKLIIKQIILLVTFQLIIIIAALFIISLNIPIDSEEVCEITIEVEEINYEYQFLNRRMLRIVSDSEIYSFPKMPALETEDYSMKELHQRINVGDCLKIKYINSYSEQRIIIDAYEGDEILRSMSSYNNYMAKQRNIGMITFILIEGIYIINFLLFLLINGKDIKKCLFTNYSGLLYKHKVVNK